ncbi:aldehyde dehydrogenase [Gluconacetobacter johannae DSM 13595]|uniref:(2Fe-2S)-binding protein n=1 Tax=Gluconacetobacter johannae TaxID=112140 RepID=A0A7W4J6L9_9PROT|nr:(2Fe-2S)-binding protein [Gluconacetobacter johannae]MBB2175596.1 (2Fe-2S)-binding protein [Gluconacetobacter johannae]GBQ85947.1 aldehyde dehydrogenase [Gluconacetobacter johannae DSM 13595]
MSIPFQLNGRPVSFDGPEDTPLLWVVREHFGLTGSKFGCGIGMCGACTMHVDGAASRTCVLAVGNVRGRAIRTIEGVAAEADNAVRKAWNDLDVPQCGYCQSGMIMTATAMLADTPSPTDQDIDRWMTNLCRCATYVRIRQAIHAAARSLKS